MGTNSNSKLGDMAKDEEGRIYFAPGPWADMVAGALEALGMEMGFSERIHAVKMLADNNYHPMPTEPSPGQVLTPFSLADGQALNEGAEDLARIRRSARMSR